MRPTFDELFALTRPAFRQQRTFDRAHQLALALLLCLGRRTITGMLCASGQQFHDWSATYRLFEQERIDCKALAAAVVKGTLATLPQGAPLVGAIDDTLIRKSGRKVAGTSWRRDPLGPKFADNFVWASRFLQLSLALPASASGSSPARMIPVDLTHCPSPRKPGRKGTEEQWRQWRELSSKAAIPAKGAARMAALRATLDEQGMSNRQLIMSADGTFTCAAVFRSLPPRTTLIGRIRKDAALFKLPTEEEQNKGRGRRRAYGERLPTPEEIRKDDTIAWQPVKAYAAGREHTFDVKVLGPCRWKHAGGERQLRLIVVRPLGYRPRQGSNLLYRAPAYLITTDLEMPLAPLLQAYLWRWEIEVNFRDEKTLVGMGEAQVWTTRSVETLTPFVAAVYAMLLIAQERCGRDRRTLPSPKWRKPSGSTAPRTSTNQMIQELRAEVWGAAMAPANKMGFPNKTARGQRMPKIENSLHSAVCYASG